MTVEEHLASSRAIANLIDQTLLKPEATADDIVRLCHEAAEHRFCSVCVNPHWVRLAHTTLAGSTVRVCATIGFPLGANRASTKLAEAQLALAEGAAEIDMVQNVGALRSADFDTVQTEIARIAAMAHDSKALLKVILETCLLTDDQKRTTCRLAVEAKADFVKTSTGFSTSGATEEDISLMRHTVGPAIGVKASGGIRSLDAVKRMVAAGATRIGTSSGVQILREFREGSSAAANPAPGAY